jgi:hypothetical protein
MACKRDIQKLANVAENAFADRAILLDENLLLCEQNNEKATCKSIRATVVGSARVTRLLRHKNSVISRKQRPRRPSVDDQAESGCSSSRKEITWSGRGGRTRD